MSPILDYPHTPSSSPLLSKLAIDVTKCIPSSMPPGIVNNTRGTSSRHKLSMKVAVGLSTARPTTATVILYVVPKAIAFPKDVVNAVGSNVVSSVIPVFVVAAFSCVNGGERGCEGEKDG